MARFVCCSSNLLSMRRYFTAPNTDIEKAGQSWDMVEKQIILGSSLYVALKKDV
jgi:hypothetical protein